MPAKTKPLPNAPESGFRLRFPFVTLLLSAVIAGVYFFLSQGAPYIAGEKFFPFAAVTNGDGQAGIFSHMFLHVGLQHLIGNLVPLLLFGAVIEIAVGALDVLAIFLVSGILSGMLFSFLNPGTPLVGASAGIAGLMGGALVVRPRHSLALLLLTPVVLSLAFVPAASVATEQYSQGVSQKAQELSQQIAVLEKQNKTAEAAVVSRELGQVKQREAVFFEGRAREGQAQTSLYVHLFGAILGACYLAAFRKKSLEGGKEEFAKLGEHVYDAVEGVGAALKKR